MSELNLNDLIENPEDHGFKPIHCDICGETNYYSVNHVGGCMCQMQQGGLPE